MKKLLLAILLALIPSAASAECNGLFPPLTICGNTSQTQNGIPTAIPFSSVLGNINLADAHILIGNPSNVAAPFLLSGDGTLSDVGVFTLAASGVTAGTYGDGTHSTQVTFDAKGRATSASSVAINIPSSAVSGLGTFATQNYATPPAIGGTTPNSGAFTTLSAQSGTVTGPWYINQGSFTPSVSFPSATAPFGVNESATGTCTTGANNCYFNFLNISSDNAVVGSGTSGTFVTGAGFLVNHNFGGASTTGNRTSGSFILTQTATTGNTAQLATYAAVVANTQATANDNGTDAGPTNSRGQVESLNVIAGLGPSATFFNSLQGAEFDTSMAAGSSAYKKVGVQITQFGTDKVGGSSYDTAIGIANQTGAIGWTNGILFGGLGGTWPFLSTGTAITCASCGTLGSFIDMSGATFSNYFLKDNTFFVKGNGVTEILASGTPAQELLVEGNDGGSSGGTIQLTNTFSGATNPNKFIRVLNNGTLQFLNSAFSASIMSITDGGALGNLSGITSSGSITFTGLTQAGLVTTTSGGLLGSETGITPAQCPAATSSAIGCAKPDGTTITVSGGVLTAIGAATTSIDAGGATSVTNGTPNTVLTDNAGKVGTGISTASIASLTTKDQTLSGGANITPAALTTGNITVDCGANPGQYVANTGAFTITAPSSDGMCDVQIENGAGAGAVTFSGFSEGSNTGDALDTTSGHKFLIGITRIHGTSHYLVSALQ